MLKHTASRAILPLFALLPLGCTTHTPPPRSTAPVIVHLVSRHQTITIHATPTGPVYSVKDNSGAVIVAAATLDQLRRDHPAIYNEINSAIATAISARAAMDSRE
ncbi:MAG: hypothetical protein NTU53_06090 [Planctomycetota bacterium]|nr:hypothetical protein [Planctomycetota bacterium]